MPGRRKCNVDRGEGATAHQADQQAGEPAADDHGARVPAAHRSVVGGAGATCDIGDAVVRDTGPSTKRDHAKRNGLPSVPLRRQPAIFPSRRVTILDTQRADVQVGEIARVSSVSRALARR